MSTRSYIGKLINGNVHSVYCHHDGYPEGVGQTLLNHYNEKNVNQLLELGGISSLCNTIEETAQNAYHEDVHVDTREDYLSDNGPVRSIDYSYLLEDDTWIVYNHRKNKEYNLLEILSDGE